MPEFAGVAAHIALPRRAERKQGVGVPEQSEQLYRRSDRKLGLRLATSISLRAQHRLVKELRLRRIWMPLLSLKGPPEGRDFHPWRARAATSVIHSLRSAGQTYAA